MVHQLYIIPLHLFGDITAKTQAARLVVTGQMIGDLVILGLAIGTDRRCGQP